MNDITGELVRDVANRPEKDCLGIFYGLPNAEYRSYPGLSYSGLKEFNRSPAHYRAYLERESKPTAGQLLGTLTHLRVLEPETFFSKVVCIDGRRNAKAVMEKIEEAEREGKISCKPDEYEASNRMGESVLKHKVARSLLTGGKPEVSIVVFDETFGLIRKARPDYLREDGVISDVKTFSDASPSAVQRQIRRMLYGWQSAWYLDVGSIHFGRPLSMFAHIFVEDEPPYGTNVYVLGDASLDRARYQYGPLLAQYSECVKTNVWLSYAEEIHAVELEFWD